MPEERAARLVLAVDAMLAGGELTRALRAEPDLRSGTATPGLGQVLGRLETLTGRFDEARTTLTTALHTADGDRGGRAVAAAHLALVSLIEGDAAVAGALAAQALRPSGSRGDGVSLQVEARTYK